ncbi:MAG: helix-turn-helix domain-containing protein [Patescibacteria group bacterium]|jgi:cytoskeletal protein RodZ
MMNFSAKQLNQYETVAEIFSAARKSKNVDLAKAEKVLKINKKYLLALENAEYEKMPGEVYIKNFARAYAQYLDLNVKNVLKLADRELEITKKIGQTPEIVIQPKTQEMQKIIITPKTIRVGAIILLAIACVIYLGWEINSIFSPPFLSISSPTEDLISKDNFITVEGQTVPEAQLTINGQEILADQNGYFRKQLDLQTGINNIEIKSQKKRSKESIVIRRVMVEEQPTPETTMPTDRVQPVDAALPTQNTPLIP